MVMNVDPVIAKAEELLERLGNLDEVRRYYEAREMAIHDEITRITGAKLEGKLEMAKNMLLKKLPEDLISDVSGLSMKQIQVLKEIITESQN